jgi:hypothetical protein
LAVQDDDLKIHELETRLAELRPRLDAMARERDKALAGLQEARHIAASEERRRHEIAARVAQHRALHEKNQLALNSVTSMKEATAATAQLETARRMIDEDERELAQIGQRAADANRLVDGANARRLSRNRTGEARDSLRHQSDIEEAGGYSQGSRSESGERPARAAQPLRSDSIAPARSCRLSAEKQFLRKLRHDASAPTSESDAQYWSNRSLRGMRSDVVRVGMMIVGDLHGR